MLVRDITNKLRRAITYRSRLVIYDILDNYDYDINSIDKYGRTLLMLAIEARMPDIAAIIITKCANINQKDANGRTALIYSVLCDMPDITNKLMNNRDVDHNIIDNMGNDAAHYMAMFAKN